MSSSRAAYDALEPGPLRDELYPEEAAARRAEHEQQAQEQTARLAQYRRLIGAVLQDDHLLAGSIAENIAFFDPQPEDRRIEAAARVAAVHEEIHRMPMGYQTLVGDLGTSLSGGQKQRVLLARALYKRPKILVLDEATSHLDVFNERRVNQAISGLKLTRIVVAHRPETIASAGRVIALGSADSAEQSEVTEPVAA